MFGQRFSATRITTGTYLASALMAGVLLATWMRALNDMAGYTIHVWVASGITLTLGLVMGFGLVPLLRRQGWRLQYLRVILLILGALATLLQLAWAPKLAREWQAILTAILRDVAQYQPLLYKSCAYLLLPWAIFTGLLSAVALRLHCESARGRLLYNGALLVILGVLPIVLGHLVGRTVLLPSLGLGSTLRCGILWFMVLAGLGLPRKWGVVPPLVGGLLLLWPQPRACDQAFSSGTFSRLMHRDSGFAQGVPTALELTPRHTVATFADQDYTSVLTLDGRPVAFGNRFHASRTLAALIPFLIGPENPNLLLYGAESGLFLPYLAAGEETTLQVAKVDATQLHLVLQAQVAPHATVTNSVPDYTYQRTCLKKGRAFDLIYVAAEPTWQPHAAATYGHAFFKQCRQALAPQGLVALHLDGRGLARGYFATIARAFITQFPHMQIWYTGAYDWLLIGSTTTISIDAATMLERFEQRAIEDLFTRSGIFALPEVMACMLCDGAGVAPWLEKTRGITQRTNAWQAPQYAYDDHPDLWLMPHNLEDYRQTTLEWFSPGTLDGAIYQALRTKATQYAQARTLAARAVWRMEGGRGDLGLREAQHSAKLNPRDPLLLQLADMLELEGRRRVTLGEFKGGLKCYENMLSFVPESSIAHFGMGYCLRALGDHENAYLHFMQAVESMPEQLVYRTELAQIAAAIGDYDEAERQYLAILERQPDNLEIRFRFAKTLVSPERPDKDYTRAIKMAEEVCQATQWQVEEYAYGLADIYMEAGRVLEGMGLKRRLKGGL